MLLSGCIHTLLLSVWSQDWNSPISFRKPVLFGFSTGLTLWSCLYVIQCLKPTAVDRFITMLLSGSLLIEVGLITVQAWRGTASHFNEQGMLNFLIEQSMLGLIICASAIVAWITWQSFRQNAYRFEYQRGSERALRLAIQAGMLFLLGSCMVGFLITYVGKLNQSQGLSPEIYLAKGVLKFPHGATLHAIQVLVLIVWIGKRLNSKYLWHAVLFGVVAHVLWLAFSIQQTLRGRDRWDMDSYGMGLFFLTGLVSLIAAVLLVPRTSDESNEIVVT
jgi:hypothetical protein